MTGNAECSLGSPTHPLVTLRNLMLIIGNRFDSCCCSCWSLMYLMVGPNPECLQIRGDFPLCLADSGSEACCQKENTGLSVLCLSKWLSWFASLPASADRAWAACGEPAGYRTDAKGDAPVDQWKGWRDLSKGFHPAVGLRSAFDGWMGGCNTEKPFSLQCI